MVSEVLLKRPGGYGETSSLELNPNYGSYKSRKPWIKALFITLPFLILGVLPFIMQTTWFVSQQNIQQGYNIFGLKTDYTFNELGASFLGDSKVFDFKKVEGENVGPFGLLAILLSMFIPFSFALFFSIAYSTKTKNLIKTRKDTKVLESEFANSLFQLGNRLGDGIPAEIAFGRVAESTLGQKSSDFFLVVSRNIQQGGMDVESAVFDKRRGAITYFPSALISTSMRILI